MIYDTATRLVRVAVFCALLSPFLNARTAAQESTTAPVTVVFYNLKNYLSMDRRVDGEVLEGAPKPDKEIKPLVEAIKVMQPDILGVCEIGDLSHLNDLQARLKTAGIDLPETELVTAASGFNRNLALLSRFPIIARNSRDDYSYNIGDLKLPFQRGVLDVTLRINPQYHLRYIGLHLKSKREIPEADQALMRLNEAQLAREHIDRIFEEEPGTNLLVSGDFNDLRIEPPVKALQGRFGRKDYLSSLTLDDKYGFRWTHHWSFADSYSRFDYVLYSKGISKEIDRDQSHIYHWDDWDKASDHRPLVVRVVPVDE
ncbi:MAG: endonuclease/exonuclease/phosphatase family protein [Verrucomicrobiales bacterium]|nr:endonuclease/exonuclease/phosphatase family protein [Verrucomicrobiales bacterium]